MPCSSSALLQGKCLPTICNHLQGKQYDYADFTQPKLVYEGVHKWGTPIAGWFRMEHPIAMDHLAVPKFSETLI